MNLFHKSAFVIILLLVAPTSIWGQFGISEYIIWYSGTRGFELDRNIHFATEIAMQQNIQAQIQSSIDLSEEEMRPEMVEIMEQFRQTDLYSNSELLQTSFVSTEDLTPEIELYKKLLQAVDPNDITQPESAYLTSIVIREKLMLYNQTLAKLEEELGQEMNITDVLRLQAHHNALQADLLALRAESDRLAAQDRIHHSMLRQQIRLNRKAEENRSRRIQTHHR